MSGSGLLSLSSTAFRLSSHSHSHSHPARRQASGEHHSLPTEVRYLILHGILHALGYDHEADDGEMNALEIEVRAQVGLA